MIYSRIGYKDESFNDHIVPWWSFGKVIIAAACLKLVEMGRLSLDEHYFDRKGTLRQLLRHEAGEPDYGGHPKYHEAVNNMEKAWSFEKMMQTTERFDLLFEPGEGWMYSNIGYYYLRRLIETTMELPLNDALEKLIFDPLDIQARVAMDPRDLKDCIHVRESYDPGWLYHGMIIGKVSEACKCLHRIANGHLFSEEMFCFMKEAYELHFDIGDRPWKKPSYAYGLMMDLSDNSFGHTGMGPDSCIAVYHFPDRNVTCAVSTETTDQGVVEFKAVELSDMKINT